MKKSTKDRIWNILLPILALLLMVLFAQISRAQQPVYRIGASHNNAYPQYLTTPDTVKIDSFATHHLGIVINIRQLCSKNKTYVLVETATTSLYLVSGYMRTNKKGKQTFIANKPFRGVRREKIKNGKQNKNKNKKVYQNKTQTINKSDE